MLKTDWLEKIDSALIISFLALMTFPALYALRRLDDNTLTSWRWVFADGDMMRVFGFIAFGTAAAFFLSKMKFPERHPSLFLLSVSFIVVVPLWDAPESILDAGRYMLQAKHLELYGIGSFFREWGGEIGIWTDLPVVSFFYGIIFRYLGEARIYIQIFTTLLFSLTVVLTYLIGKALWDRETGLIAALLLPGIPYLLIQAPLMLVDVPFMFLLTLSLYTFLITLEKGGIVMIAAASTAIVLTAFSKYSAWPMLLMLPLVSIVSARQGSRAVIARSIAVLVCAGIISAAVFFMKQEVFLNQLSLLHEYQWPGLKRWQESFISTFFFQIHPAITLAALFSVFLAAIRRDVSILIPAWFVVFVLVFQVERIRYMLPLFPLLTLMAAYGFRGVRDFEIRKFIAFCILAASLAVAFGGYLPFLNKTNMANLRNAAVYLDSLPGGAVAVQIHPQKNSTGNTEMAIPILDLYTRKNLVYDRGNISRPTAEHLQKSSLKFSWEISPPRFYSTAVVDSSSFIAVISSEQFMLSENNNSLLSPFSKKGRPGFPLKTFTSDTGTFRYKTFVAVFNQNRLAETAQ